MPIDLRKERVLVALFVQPGCGACEEFEPRFDRVAKPYRADGMPIVKYNVQSQDAELMAFMDRYKITATPTVLILRRGPGSLRVEGSVEDPHIEQALGAAYRIHRGG